MEPNALTCPSANDKKIAGVASFQSVSTAGQFQALQTCAFLALSLLFIYLKMVLMIFGVDNAV